MLSQYFSQFHLMSCLRPCRCLNRTKRGASRLLLRLRLFLGIAGYWLGYFAFDAWLAPIIESWGYTHKIETATQWFADYGVWVVFVAGFSPIPYKVFTTSAGFLQMAFFPFLIASAVGRGARFFLVAGLMRWGGAPMEAKLRQYVEVLGWAVVLLAVAAYLILR